eukprot:g69119.t1
MHIYTNERSPLLGRGRRAGKIEAWGPPLILLGLALVVIAVFTFSPQETVEFKATALHTAQHHADTMEDTKEFHAQSGNILSFDRPPAPSRASKAPPLLLAKDIKPPVPTSAWWTSLAVPDKTDANVGQTELTPSPYTVSFKTDGLWICYGGAHRNVLPDHIDESFMPDVLMGTIEHLPTKTITGFDRLSVSVRYGGTAGGKGRFPCSIAEEARLPTRKGFLGSILQWLRRKLERISVWPQVTTFLVRGSPYVTIAYQQATPVLQPMVSIINVNGEDPYPFFGAHKPVTYTANRFYFKSSGNNDWILYADPAIALTFINGTYFFSKETYTGILRVAFVPTPTNRTTVSNTTLIAALDKHADTWPYGAEVTYHVSEFAAAGPYASLKFEWKTCGPGTPLMLAFPHHVENMLKKQEITETGQNEMMGLSGYMSMKGEMTALVGTQWRMTIRLEEPTFAMATPIKNPTHIQAIRDALKVDIKIPTFTLQDPYFFGKEAARTARLMLIAEELREDSIKQQLLSSLIAAMTPWMLGKNEDPFIYETEWGGLCSKRGLDSMWNMTDFGNGWFNDHHFHYGYIIYAAAAIGKLKPEWLQDYMPMLEGLIRDIANPSSNDPYFPPARHFSWFDGHSWASGHLPLGGGKSQESVSEAINAYYAVRLFANVTKNERLMEFGTLLMTMEMQGARTYWQMPSSTTIYEPLYAANKMTGQVGTTMVAYDTWFGVRPEWIHLINFIPFTPATEHFISPEFVQEEYPVLKKTALDRPDPPIEIRWVGYAAMAHAMIDPKTAWKEMLAISPDSYDDGDSMTAALHWVASRPGHDSDVFDSAPSAPTAPPG